MAIFLKNSWNVPPARWGSFADVQYAVRINSEKVYGIDSDSIVLAVPLFWEIYTDFSAYKNTITNYGATKVKNEGFYFNGSTYMIVSQDPSLEFGTGNFSLSYRFKTGSSDTLAMLGYGDRDDSAGWTSYIGVNGVAKIIIDDSSTQVVTEEATNRADNIKHNYIVSIDKSNDQIIYIDGRNIASDNVTGVGNVNTNDHDSIQIGRMWYYNEYKYPYTGTLYDLRINNSALTETQAKLFNALPYDLYQKVSRPFYLLPIVEGITLTIEALDGVGTLDNVALTQKHNLSVQELLSSGALDNVALTQKHLLALQGLLSSGTLDAVSLTQKHILSVQELSGVGTLDNVTLTQKHILVVQELLSSGALDNIELIQKHTLIIQELASAGALDNIELTQKHLLAIQSLLSAGTLDNIELLLSTLLVVADLLSAGQLDNVGLTQKHILTVNEVLSAGQLDNVGLTQKHILTVDEVLSAGQLDGVALTQKNLLAINDLISSGVIDNINFDVAAGLIYITLSQATEYDIELSQTTEYDITLTQTGGGVQ